MITFTNTIMIFINMVQVTSGKIARCVLLMPKQTYNPKQFPLP